jgi:hypothetical protein
MKTHVVDDWCRCPACVAGRAKLADAQDERGPKEQALDAALTAHAERVTPARAAVDGDILTPNISTQPHILTSSSGDQASPTQPFSTTTGVYHPTSDTGGIAAETRAESTIRNAYSEELARSFTNTEGYEHKVYGAAGAVRQMQVADLADEMLVQAEKELTLADLPPIRMRESIVDYAARLPDRLRELFEKHCADVFNRAFTTEKDPPAPTPDVHIKDFNTPQERVVPSSDNMYEGPTLHIVFSGQDHSSLVFAEIEDSDNKSVNVGTWVKRKDGCHVLVIPDWRDLIRKIETKNRHIEVLIAANTDLSDGRARVANQLDTVKGQLDAWSARFSEILVLRYERQLVIHLLDEQRIRELRATNRQILDHDRAMVNRALELRKQLDAARSEGVVERQNPRSQNDPVTDRSNNGPYPDNLYGPTSSENFPGNPDHPTDPLEK